MQATFRKMTQHYNRQNFNESNIPPYAHIHFASNLPPYVVAAILSRRHNSTMSTKGLGLGNNARIAPS